RGICTKMKYITISNLSFSYEEGGRLILKDINTEVKAGEFICILGQSGCGKSTLLRLLAGLEKAKEGEIRSGERKIEGDRLERRGCWRDWKNQQKARSGSENKRLKGPSWSVE